MIYLKNPSEIALMRKSGQITADVLKLIEDNIKVGVETAYLDKLAYDYIVGCGAKPSFLGYGGFPGSICVSIDEQVVHGFPSERRLEEGEIVSIDVGSFLNGFHSDAARTFLVGNVSPEKKKLVDVTKECFFKGLEEVMVGGTLGDIGGAIQEHAESNGYSVVREMVGHGVGRNLHEDPSVPNYGKRRTGIRLRSGMTLAIEPMINMGGKEVVIDGWSCVTRDKSPSAHYENTVALTSEGVEILTLR